MGTNNAFEYFLPTPAFDKTNLFFVLCAKFIAKKLKFAQTFISTQKGISALITDER